MKSNTDKSNPFADASGNCLPGKAEEFFDWERKNELKKRALLPAKEVAEIKESEQALAKRMDS